MKSFASVMRMDRGVASQVAVAPLLKVDYQTFPLSTSSNSAAINAALAAVDGYLTRASTATVQVGATVIDTGIGVNAARIGNGGYGQGLVLERARTQLITSLAIDFQWIAYNCTDLGRISAGPATALSRRVDVLACPNPGDASVLYRGATVTSGNLHTASVWYQGLAASQVTNLLLVNAGDTLSQNLVTNLTTGWQKFQVSKVTSDYPFNNNWFIELGTDRNAAGVGATLAQTWNAACAQLEDSWCATEWVPSGTCAIDRHGFNSSTALLDGGRIGVELQMVMKYASSVIPVGSKVALWGINASNYCYIENVAGTLIAKCVVAGVSYSGGVAPAWSQFDVLYFWCEAGGGALNSKMAYKIGAGGAEVVLGTNAPQGTVPSALRLDICHLNGADGHYTWMQVETFYPANARPAWVS